MPQGKIVEPLLQHDTQKEQNAFVTESARTEPGEHGGARPPVDSSDTDTNDTLPTEMEVGTSEANYDGRQSGTSRAEHAMAGDTGGTRSTEQAPQAAFEGDLATRTPGGEKQGISNASSDEDAAGQRKVVGQRPDARAGVNPFKR